MIEIIVFDILSEEIEQLFPDADIVDQYQPEVSSFPHVQIVMDDVSDHVESLTPQVNFENINFQIDVFTIGQSKKKDAKQIADKIQDEMYLMGFLRRQRRVVTNIGNRDVYRIVLRFTATRKLNTNIIYRR